MAESGQDPAEFHKQFEKSLEGFITGRKEGLTSEPPKFGALPEEENSLETQFKVLQRWVFETLADLEERVTDLENLKGVTFTPLDPQILNDMVLLSPDDDDDGTAGSLATVN